MNVGAPFVHWEPGLPPERLSERLFDGALVVFRGLPAVEALRQRVVALLRAAFADDDPETAERRLPPDLFRKRAMQARRQVEDDAEVDTHWSAISEAVGYPADEILQDRVRLRAVPASNEARGRVVRPLPVHRDTWASGVQAQVNWWMPLFPLADDRTMLLWPDRFRTPVRNTAASWDYETLRAKGFKDYPLLPEAEEDPGTSAVPVRIAPGSLLGFAAAHLHASVGDDPDRARFSLDTRTVWTADLTAGRAAPDVDGGGNPPNWDMFARPSTATARGNEIDRPTGGAAG
ncbi:MAG: hypothetical protein AAFX81_14980 [Pseudomonadota bacterium]